VQQRGVVAGAGTHPRWYQHCWRVPRLLLQPWLVFRQSPSMGDAAQLWGPWGGRSPNTTHAAEIGCGTDAMGAASEARVGAAGVQFW